MKIKIITLTACAAVVLSLTACGGGIAATTGAASSASESADKESTTSQETENLTVSEETSESITTKETTKEATKEATKETTEERTTETSDETSEETSGSLSGGINSGITVNNTYINSSLGVGVTIPDNWYFLSQDEIASVLGTTAQLIPEDSDVSEYIKNNSTLMDMYASDSEGLNTMNLNITSLEYMGSMSAEEIAQNITPELSSQLEDAGYENLSTAIQSREVCGQDRPVIHIEATFYGYGLYEDEIIFTNDDYCGILTVACVGSEIDENIWSCFFKP